MDKLFVWMLYNEGYGINIRFNDPIIFIEMIKNVHEMKKTLAFSYAVSKFVIEENSTYLLETLDYMKNQIEKSMTAGESDDVQ